MSRFAGVDTRNLAGKPALAIDHVFFFFLVFLPFYRVCAHMPIVVLSDIKVHKSSWEARGSDGGAARCRRMH